MKTTSLLFLALLASIVQVSAQTITNKTILTGLENELTATENDAGMLISNTGLNVFLQRKTLNYLTGVSDLSLAKFYASLSTESDRLNIGFNIPVKYSDNSLMLLLNPIIESDIKNGFSTLYKDDEWRGTVRAGMKITYLFPWGTMNFLPEINNGVNIKKNNLNLLRKKKYDEIAKALKDEDSALITPVKTFSGTTTTPISDQLTDRQLRVKERKQYEVIGIAEADYIEKHKSYTWMQTSWLAVWGFTPVTEANKYISPNYSTAFAKTKFKLWELNLQYTHLFQNSRLGTFFISPWLKRFQNNSANADLMESVDYGQYSQIPGTAQTNLALIETNSAFVGDYKEFMTTNFNMQAVYIFPLTETLLKPGISVRYEKNWGTYSPENLRFGIPIAIQGKSTPINVEFQYRINDISNYRSVANHSPKETFGVSVGLPFALLYK